MISDLSWAPPVSSWSREMGSVWWPWLRPQGCHNVAYATGPVLDHGVAVLVTVTLGTEVLTETRGHPTSCSFITFMSSLKAV